MLVLLQICAAPGVEPRFEIFAPTRPICERMRAALVPDALVREHPGIWECRAVEAPRHAEACTGLDYGR